MFPNPASPDEILLKQTDPMRLSDFQRHCPTTKTHKLSTLALSSCLSSRPKHSAKNPHQVSQEALLGLQDVLYTHQTASSPRSVPCAWYLWQVLAETSENVIKVAKKTRVHYVPMWDHELSKSNLNLT